LKKSISYLTFSLLLIGLAITIASCGGGSDVTGIVPAGITETEQMVQKTVSGFIYNIPGQSVDRFIIIDCSISGEESFLNQMSSYLQNNYPDIWNTAEIQELFNQLAGEMAGWQTLPKYNPGALLYTAYSDTPIQVGEDGYFEATVSVPAGEENIHLEVVAGEECFGVETVASSDFLTSGAAGQGQLKCSHKSIIALPGGLCLFKVFSIPPADLRGSLVFEFNDLSAGTMTPPFFLKIKGEMNYNLACGVFRANETAVKGKETKISNGNGNNLYVPVDIVHETSSVSGKVHTGGEPLIKGHVTSIGPKSSCHLDENGNYVLPEVFQGSYRKVTATWWTEVGGKQVKHTEIKYIENLAGDVTNFDFGVSVEPTPTPRHPMDPVYQENVAQVISQFELWQAESGDVEAIRKTNSWLNGELPSPPHPEFIIESAIESEEPPLIWIRFADAWGVRINFGSLMTIPPDPNISSSYSYSDREQSIPGTRQAIAPTPTFNPNADTPSSSDILIMAPFAWYDKAEGLAPPDEYTVYYGLANYLESKNYLVTKKVISVEDFLPGEVFEVDHDEVEIPNITDPDKCVRPEDFYEIRNNYGVVYLRTADTDFDPFRPDKYAGLYCGPIFSNDETMYNWIYNNLDYAIMSDPLGGLPPVGVNWFIDYIEARNLGRHIPVIVLEEDFFNDSTNFPENSMDSILYVSVSSSQISNHPIFSKLKNMCSNTYIGWDYYCYQPFGDIVSYFFFRYMIFGYDTKPELNDYPKTIDKDAPVPIEFTVNTVDPAERMAPMNVKDVYNKLEDLGLVTDENTYVIYITDDYGNILNTIWWSGGSLEFSNLLPDPSKDTYFPSNTTTITIEKNH